MKQLFLPFIFLFMVAGVSAQVPGMFSFQGVAKNANGQPLAAGTIIKVRFKIHENGAAGQVVYSETHSPTVTQGGIFNVFIGGGQDKAGTDLDEISWGKYPYYLQVEMAVDGINYVDMGTTQLVSVPYAAYAAQARRWESNVPVIQKGVYDQSYIVSVEAGPRLIWHPGKAAFRAGENYEGAWEQANIGPYSFAGNRGLASGSYSTAFGGGSALGNYSFSAGINAKASGDYSSAFGSYSEAEGEASTAFGAGIHAKAFGGFAVGIYNNVQDNPSGTYQGNAATDRIFQIGNGTLQSHSNALTVLRNGNVGIGNNVLAPTHIFEVGGRARMRHSGSTAGIFFDNSQNSPFGFVGMQNDKTIGFYIKNHWVLTVDGDDSAADGVTIDGYLVLNGPLFDSSDRRLKRDFSKLNNSFTKLNSLQGYNYYWKDATKGQSLQTGLIAQEVEVLFPELVKTDEKGMKSVNYVGLVPHLIEAIKELKKENQERLGQLEAKLDMLLKAADTQETARSK